MDLADTKNGTKIVEYNCWNGSGLYYADKKLLFKSVEEFVKNKLEEENNKTIKHKC